MNIQTKFLCAALAVLVVSPSLALAQEEQSLGVTLDSTFVTQFIWRGYDVFDDHGAWQPSVDVDLFGTGFSLNVWGSIPIGSSGNGPATADGINGWQRYDYTLAYGYTFFEEETYALDLSANYIYYDFPKLNKQADAQEIGAGIAMPNLLTIGDSALVPSYYAGCFYPVTGGVSGVAGWYHEIGLDYSLEVPGFMPGTETQAIDLGWDIAYSADMYDVNAWTHTTFTVAVPMEFGPVSVSPFVAYQITMEEDVNSDEDEIVGGLSVSWSF